MIAGVYLVELDSGCTLDTPTFLIQGLTRTRFDYSLEMPRPEALKIEFLNDEFWNNVTKYLHGNEYATSINVLDIETLSIPDLPDAPQRKQHSLIIPFIVLTIVSVLGMVGTLAIFLGSRRKRGCAYLSSKPEERAELHTETQEQPPVDPLQGILQ